ncbi:neuromedin-B isoform X2 [Phacochoerus africanus]|uniref:neuromedin-B isoform X2 n=1 Tax=Phacochoerus africanus TaxID=41426 RepID=UPI001FD8C2E5|nr:neuromedin-B isoform X2 [Phacochoerus africanus]
MQQCPHGGSGADRRAVEGPQTCTPAQGFRGGRGRGGIRRSRGGFLRSRLRLQERGFKRREGAHQALELRPSAPEQRCGRGPAMTLRARGARLLGGLLFFTLLAAGAAPLSWDLPEPRSLPGKIRVHPRGNLWATGHFMGKKSLEPPNPSLLGTTHHISLRDQRLQLSHDLLRILLQKKALGLSLSGPASHTLYRRLLVQTLEK